MGFKRMFDAVETHCGEPMRVVTGGIPTIPGIPFTNNADGWRKMMTSSGN